MLPKFTCLQIERSIQKIKNERVTIQVLYAHEELAFSHRKQVANPACIEGCSSKLLGVALATLNSLIEKLKHRPLGESSRLIRIVDCPAMAIPKNHFFSGWQ